MYCRNCPSLGLTSLTYYLKICPVDRHRGTDSVWSGPAAGKAELDAVTEETKRGRTSWPGSCGGRAPVGASPEPGCQPASASTPAPMSMSTTQTATFKALQANKEP